MKKIINGKRYDTETAQAMGEYSFSYPGQFHYLCETLYRKKTGEYFLHGEGGASSRYSQRIDMNTWSGGEAIVPLTYQEAVKWAEEHLDGDEYEQIFGEVDESLDNTNVSYSMPTAAAALIKREAEKTGKTQGALIAELILGAYGPKE